jgi:GntR family histidine utilization transcriptional repressor
MSQTKTSLPRYAQIKGYIKAQLESGQWQIGQRIPSETQLSEQFTVSRMLERSVGAGTFVTQPPSQNWVVELPDYSRLFSFSNPEYSNRIVTLEAIAAPREIAALLGLQESESIYRSVVVHSSGSAPLQWEECFVSAALVPAYLKQKYQKVSPQTYIDWVIAPSYRL